MTWSALCYRSFKDYVSTNNKLSLLLNDTKVFRGYDVATNNSLLISKTCLPQKLYTFFERSPRPGNIFKVYLLEDASIKLLYERRLEQNFIHSPCSLHINVE
jgi:hypothetical protein